MNRRFFVTKALAGLAAVPIIGRLLAPQQASGWTATVQATGPVKILPVTVRPQTLYVPFVEFRNWTTRVACSKDGGETWSIRDA